MRSSGQLQLKHGYRPNEARRAGDGTAQRRPPLFITDDAAKRDRGGPDATGDGKDFDFLREPGFWIAILLGCLPIVASFMYVLFVGD
jgi:hypothetical protein